MATENEMASSNGFPAIEKVAGKQDDAHQPIVEETVDEDDLGHGQAPTDSKAVLESPEDAASASAVPGWTPTVSAKAAGKQKETTEGGAAAPIDTGSETLFPGLGSAPAKTSFNKSWKSTASNGPAPANGTSNGHTAVKGSTPVSGATTPVTRTPGLSIPGRHEEKISLEPTDLLPKSAMKKPIADVVKDINKKSKAKITSLTGERGTLHFTAQGPPDACRQALSDLVKQVGLKRSVKVQIPRATRAHIIGKQGSTIKSIQEKTGARIQMPKMDEPRGASDDDDDAMIDLIIEGNTLSAAMARLEVLKIVGDRTASVNQKLRDIPYEFYPFIDARTRGLEEQSKDLRVQVPVRHTLQPSGTASEPIILSGDKLAVAQARAEIQRHDAELRKLLTKKQEYVASEFHQFIIGDNGIPAHEFLSETGCSLLFPNDADVDYITIIGPQSQIQIAYDKAMDLATSMNNSKMDLVRHYRGIPAGEAAIHARNVTRYLRQRQELSRLEKKYNAMIKTSLQSEASAPWDLFSREKKQMALAQAEIAGILTGHPPSRMSNVPVDSFFHQHIRKEVSPKIMESYGVHTVVPSEADTDMPILLVFEGPAGSNTDFELSRTPPSAEEVVAFRSALEEAQKYILAIIDGQEPIATDVIDVPVEFHARLQRFIKNEQQNRSVDQIAVRVSNAGSKLTLRGTTSAVHDLSSKINAWIIQEREDAKERGFELTFDFPQKHTSQLVGKGGSNIRELRDKFDVDIKVDDGKVKLTGPPKKAEAAKAHITNLGKNWADQATHVLKIDPKYHRELIGQKGAQINKLQDKHSVQIHFPRGARPMRDDASVADTASEVAVSKNRRTQAEDEVMIRGPSKGANSARDEILGLYQYLQDTSFSETIAVQQSQVPQLIGQGGKGMDELRAITGARIDVPGARDGENASGLVEIQIKGTKEEVSKAKKLLQEKKSLYDKTVTKNLEVDKKHHRALIGAGGSKLREIVVNAGGSDDRRELSRTVQFPKDDGNTIKLEGDENVVAKIIAAMNEIVAQRESQVVEVVDVPIEKHRNLIGRGGATKKALETKLNVIIDIPRQGDGRTGVKLTGEPAAVAAAKAHILDSVKTDEGETIQVPIKYHHIISDNGQFFRRLRNDHSVMVDHSGVRPPAKTAAPTNGASPPLITDDNGPDAHSWHTVNVLDDDVNGEIPWVLKGQPENVAKAKSQLAAAIEAASKNTTTGYLSLPDPTLYRYVIGQKGSKVNSIRKETNCKIEVPNSKDGNSSPNDPIIILGSADGVERAKSLVLEAVMEGQASRRRD